MAPARSIVVASPAWPACRYARGSRLTSLAVLNVMCRFTDMDQFTDRCRRLYFCTDDALSEALFIIVNVGLVYMFYEAFVDTEDESQRKLYLSNCLTCQTNLEVAMVQLNLMMPASPDNIEALLMAVGGPRPPAGARAGKDRLLTGTRAGKLLAGPLAPVPRVAAHVARRPHVPHPRLEPPVVDGERRAAGPGRQVAAVLVHIQ